MARPASCRGKAAPAGLHCMAQLARRADTTQMPCDGASAKAAGGPAVPRHPAFA